MKQNVESNVHSDNQHLHDSLYRQLHRMAEQAMTHEHVSVSIQPTLLVNDAWMKLLRQKNVNPQDRGQVLAAGANIIRRLLVDHARKRNALRRGGSDGRGAALCFDVAADGTNMNLLELHDALEVFSRSFPRASEIVELRFFGGMTGAETAEHLGVSLRTVNSDWQFAKAWLYRELGEVSDDHTGPSGDGQLPERPDV